MRASSSIRSAAAASRTGSPERAPTWRPCRAWTLPTGRPPARAPPTSSWTPGATAGSASTTKRRCCRSPRTAEPPGARRVWSPKRATGRCIPRRRSHPTVGLSTWCTWRSGRRSRTPPSTPGPSTACCVWPPSGPMGPLERSSRPPAGRPATLGGPRRGASCTTNSWVTTSTPSPQTATARAHGPTSAAPPTARRWTLGGRRRSTQAMWCCRRPGRSATARRPSATTTSSARPRAEAIADQGRGGPQPLFPAVAASDPDFARAGLVVGRLRDGLGECGMASLGPVREDQVAGTEPLSPGAGERLGAVFPPPQVARNGLPPNREECPPGQESEEQAPSPGWPWQQPRHQIAWRFRRGQQIIERTREARALLLRPVAVQAAQISRCARLDRQGGGRLGAHLAEVLVGIEDGVGGTVERQRVRELGPDPPQAGRRPGKPRGQQGGGERGRRLAGEGGEHPSSGCPGGPERERARLLVRVARHSFGGCRPDVRGLPAVAHQQRVAVLAAVGRPDPPARPGELVVSGPGSGRAVERGELCRARRREWPERWMDVRRPGLDPSVLRWRVQLEVLAHEPVVVAAALREIGRDANHVPIGRDLLRVARVQA